MKKILANILLVAAAALVCSCLGDNYEQPDAGFYGIVTDAETGEPILQDIGGEGSQIEVIETAYETADTRRLNFKTDGSFQDKNFFKGRYKVQFNRVNFNPGTVILSSSNGTIAENEYVDIDGDTEMNIEAMPWCRINVTDLYFDQARQRIFAKFEVECTTNDPLLEVGLFCDPSPHVSYSINNYGDNSTKKVAVNRTLTSPAEFTLKMPLTLFNDTDSGKDFYVRVGAHTSVTDARWNYSAAEKIHIDIQEIATKPLGIRWDLFDSQYEAMWQAGKHKSLEQLYFDNKDFKSGDGCYVAVSGAIPDGDNFRFTTFISPGEGKGGIKPVFDISSIPEEGCHMLLTIYVSDATHFRYDEQSQIEIGSNGIFDDEEVGWIFGQLNGLVRNGWQTLDLSLPEAASKIGSLRLKRLNWFRFYHKEFDGNTTVKFDEIRFYYKTMIESCDAASGWQSAGALSIDESDCKEGEGAVSTVNGADGLRLQKTWSKVYVPASKSDGHLEFWLYVSDASAVNGTENQVEIGSGGAADTNELNWKLPTLVDGWNKIDLKLSDAKSVGGDMLLSAMNWFRIYSNTSAPAGSVTFKLDRLRFYKEGYDTSLADFGFDD